MAKAKFKINLIHLILLTCVLALAGFYIFQVNSIVKDRFALDTTERKLGEILEENKALQVIASEVNSLPGLKNTGYALELEEVKNISYIEAKSASPLVLR